MIDKIEFQKQNFITHGIIEPNSENGYMRVPSGWQPANNLVELREKVRDIMWDKAEEYRTKKNIKISDYGVIEICCRIPTDTTKKALKGRYNITRNFLAKFTVGLKLDMEIANSLFMGESGELNLTNDFDYIIYHALKTKDDINDFIEEVYHYLNINLDKDK